jgi:hypothetical protein
MWNALWSNFLNSSIRKKKIPLTWLQGDYSYISTSNTLRMIENGIRLLWKLRRKIRNRIGRLARRRIGRRRWRWKYGKEERTSYDSSNADSMRKVVRRVGGMNFLPFRYTGRRCGSRRMWPEEALPESLALLTHTDYNKNQRQPISDSPT